MHTETLPAARRANHGSVVQRVAAVEHHALSRERLGQVLGGLGLASASRAVGKWGPAQFDWDRGEERQPPAPKCGKRQPMRVLA